MEPVEYDTVKFTWNVQPKTKVTELKSSIQPAVDYNPLGALEVPMITYTPLYCACGAIFNSFSTIDFRNKSIQCCFCSQRTALPAKYANQITPEMLPYELMPKVETYEFKSANKKTTFKRAYLFIVDLCIRDVELASVKAEISRVVSELPYDAHVGLITYHRYVYVYELGARINNSFCMNSAKEYSSQQALNFMGVDGKNLSIKQQDIATRFVVEVGPNRDKILRRIADVKKDPSLQVNERPQCATGQALNIGISMCEISTIPIRMVLLAGGPCTVGPGRTISVNFKEQMRSTEYLSKGENIPHFAAAKKYYESLSKRLLTHSIVLDIFAFSLNEIGLTEMFDLESSGGFIVMHEEFQSHIFKDSFHKIFPTFYQEESVSNKIEVFTDASVNVYVNREIILNGALGHCHSLNVHKPFVSDRSIGKGKTHSWYLGSLDRQKSLTFFFEIRDSYIKGELIFLQFYTKYTNAYGEPIVRVTNVSRRVSDDKTELSLNFDEEAAAVQLAKLIVFKSIFEEQRNAKKWLDNVLCKWASFYANFMSNDPTSFRLPEKMKNLPQSVYHLRRSLFVKRFGVSLDYSLYYGHCLSRYCLLNAVSMIQPVLLSYRIDNLYPQAVPLEETYMQDNVILLLDSYFVVIEWYGKDVQNWLYEKYHENPEYQHIADFFNAPKQDIDYVMGIRFPVPNYHRVHPNHSKERYIKSRVIPLKSGITENYNMLTDDSDLRAFMQHLIKVVVSPS